MTRAHTLAAAVLSSIGIVVAPLSTIALQGAQRSSKLAPDVPMPQDVVERMLTFAAISSQDTVYDLGSGDGRVVITAAKKYGARGVGIEIDPSRVAEARRNAQRAGVDGLVMFQVQDALQADVSPATVVTLFLTTSANAKLRPRLSQQLKAGTRIVSLAFDMGDWKPAKVDRFNDITGIPRVLYLWEAGKTQ